MKKQKISIEERQLNKWSNVLASSIVVMVSNFFLAIYVALEGKSYWWVSAILFACSIPVLNLSLKKSQQKNLSD